jgi:hypothetical protein
MEPGRVDDFIKLTVNFTSGSFYFYGSERIVGNQGILACEVIEYLAFAGIRQPDNSDFFDRLGSARIIFFYFFLGAHRVFLPGRCV